jgi:hypothetical protein
MHDNSFEIKILDFHWINHQDDQEDLCAHGSVYVRIGDKVIVDKKDNDCWTLSAAALYLMRTIDNDYVIDDFGNQLIPHCGFFIIPNDDLNHVTIQGCPHGFDWTIVHEQNKVIHIADTGEKGEIEYEEYKKMIFDFADQVENFYNDSAPKKMPTDDFASKGYTAFWNEWKAIRYN